MGSVTTGVLAASPVPNSANTISVILAFSMGILMVPAIHEDNTNQGNLIIRT